MGNQFCAFHWTLKLLSHKVGVFLWHGLLNDDPDPDCKYRIIVLCNIHMHNPPKHYSLAQDKVDSVFGLVIFIRNNSDLE